MMKTILVGEDGSTAARRALELGVDLAARLDARIRVVHVVEAPIAWAVPGPTPEPSLAAAAWVSESRKAHEKEGRAALESALHVCAERGLEVTTDLIEGWPPRTLREEMERADLAILGRTGCRQDRLGETTGATAQYMMRRCDRPVLLVDRGAEPVREVVLGFDNSPSARRALLVAAELARRTGYRLTVAHVAERSDDRHAIAAARQALAEDAAVRATFEELKGKPYPVLAELLARKPGAMLVLGGRGHDRLADFLLGTLPESFHLHHRATLLVVR